jgi:uncharacterized membrane protein
MTSKYHLLLILFTISLISSAILAFTPVSEICVPGEGCEVVQNSPYAKTLGVENSLIGVFIFIFLILLTASQIKNQREIKKFIIYSLVIIGFFLAIYFLYIQHFILQAYCKYCLVVDFSMILALMVLLPDIKKDFPKIMEKFKK